MPDPTRLTGKELTAHLDTYPRAEAHALLHAGKVLKAAEIITLYQITRGFLVVDNLALFYDFIDGIIDRWASAGAPGEANTSAERGNVFVEHTSAPAGAEPAGDSTPVSSSLHCPPATTTTGAPAGPNIVAATPLILLEV